MPRDLLSLSKNERKEQRGASAQSHAAVVRRVTGVGLAANLVLSAIKMAGGIWGSSQAVVADAVHSLSDCATDLAILFGVRYWSKPPDDDHPYGHQRIETIITISIGFFLAAVGFGLIYNAVTSFSEPRRETPGLVALAAALISIAVKEVLYRWTRAAGDRIRSSALVANAWHQRTDVLSSIPAALAVCASFYDPRLVFLDSIGSLLVSLFILHAAWRIVTPGVDQLTDRGADKKDIESIERAAMSIEGVREVHRIRTRFSGLGLRVDLHVLVDGTLSVSKGHDISELVQACLIETHSHVVDVVVHIEPNNDAKRYKLK
ncbi:MAG: cation transporter [Deltaproteobacteria bacterium]|nr:cation transporter [Deltaproteobacteria bacterium]